MDTEKEQGFLHITLKDGLSQHLGKTRQFQAATL
jgi:hypothetical protein